MKVNFHMERLSVSIKDQKDKNEIIRLTVGEMKSTLTQRSGAQALKLVIFVWLLRVLRIYTVPYLDFISGKTFSPFVYVYLNILFK